MTKQAKRELIAQLTLDRADAVVNRPAYRWRYVLLVPLCIVLAWAGWDVLYSQSESGPLVPAELPIMKASSASTVAEVAPIAEPPSLLLQASGYTTARQSATVSARTTAVVEAVYVEEGDFVTAGSVLARLDDRLKRAEYQLAVSEHARAESKVIEVEQELAAAQRQLLRVQTLAARRLASESELDAAKTRVLALSARLSVVQADVNTAQQQIEVQRVVLGDYVIRAPFDGVITQRSAQTGEIVSPISAGGGFTRTGIATLVNMASLEIEVDVSETYINRVHGGHQVEVVLTAYPEVVYPGRVIAIIPRGDRNKGTVKVRVKLTQSDERVLPDMGARVDFLDA